MGEHDLGIDGLIEMFNNHNKLNGSFTDYYFPEKISINEVKLRKQYPTLQDAWEKYQAILKLVTTEEGTK